MNAMFDVDGTIDQNPEFYEAVMRHFSGKRVIVTGRPWTEKKITQEQLTEFGILEGEHYDLLYMFPTAYLYMRVKNLGYFYEDPCPEMFESFEHRAAKKPGGGMFDGARFQREIAEWKVKVCKENDLAVAFDDSALNALLLRESGIYVLQPK